MGRIAGAALFQRLLLIFAIAFASVTPGIVLAQSEGTTEDAETVPGNDGPESEPADAIDDDGDDDGDGGGDDGAGVGDDDGAGDDDDGGGDDEGADDDDGADDDGGDGGGDDGAGDDDGVGDDEGAGDDDGADDGDDGGDGVGDDGAGDDDGVGDDDVDLTDDIDDPRPDQAIVRLRPGVDGDEFAARFGVSVLRTIPNQDIYLLELASGRPDEEEVTEIGEDEDAVYAELNFTGEAPEARRRFFFTSGKGDPVSVNEPGLPAELDLPDRSCVAGAGVTVAVLDTGVDAAHPLFADSIAPNGANIVDDTSDISDTGNGIDDDGDGAVDEMAGHGTHVAGIVIQVAPAAEILPVKVLDSDGVGDAFFVAAGIYYALDQEADAINLSVGSTYQSRTVTEAAEFAIAQDVPVVAAAGNSGAEEPAEYPASDDIAVSIAATDESGSKADFSNFSPQVDLSAPGVDIASAYPDNRYVTLTGTSMAAPMVTGTIALMLGQNAELSPDAILDQLAAGADPIPATDAASDGKLGAGQLNVGASIDCSVRG